MKQVLEKILEEIEKERGEEDDYVKFNDKMLVRHWNVCIDVVKEIIQKHMADAPDTNIGEWIPVSERLPEYDNYILLSFANFSLPLIGRYEADRDGGGAFYLGGDEITCISQDLYVNAWQPLPEPYREE